MRHDAEIHRIAQFAQDGRCRGPNAVAARLVCARPGAETGGDRLRQRRQFPPFDGGGQIAGIRMADVDRTLGGRIYPGMQMRPDLAPAFRREATQNSHRRRRGGDGIVNDVGRHQSVRIEYVLRERLQADVGDRRVGRIEWRGPVELLFSIDHDDQGWWPGRRRGQ